MKKFLFATALLFCFALATEAQNQCGFRLIRGVDALGYTTLVFTDNTTMDVSLGSCSGGDCWFDTGTNEVAHIIINNTPCYPGNTTPVDLGEGVMMNVSEVDTEDGPIYTIE